MKAYFRSTKAGKFRGDLARCSQGKLCFVPQEVGRVAVAVTMYQTRVGAQLENFDRHLLVLETKTEKALNCIDAFLPYKPGRRRKHS